MHSITVPFLIVSCQLGNRKALQYLIFEEMKKGKFTATAKSTYGPIVQEMKEKGAHGVISGFTELPILLAESQLPVPAFNTTELHAFAAVALAGAQALSCYIQLEGLVWLVPTNPAIPPPE